MEITIPHRFLLAQAISYNSAWTSSRLVSLER